MDVLVTGGTGTLGSRLVPLLLERAHRVRVLSRQAAPTVEAGAQVVHGDLRTRAGLTRAVAGADAIVHAASNAAARGKPDVEMTRRLVEAAPAVPVIYVSIVGIDRVPFSYYRRKLECERVLADAGVPHTVLRATQFHELLAMGLRTLERFPIVPLPLSWVFQSIAAREVAEWTAELVEVGPQPRVELGGPEILSVRAIVDVWRRARGGRPRVVGVRFPGAVSRGFGEGRHTTPEHAEGRQTWAEFVRGLG